MSGGGGKSSMSSPGGQALTQIGEQVNAEVDPVRQQFLGMLQQIMSGNLYGNAQLPLIQNATSGVRQAVGQSMQGAESFLAKTGTAQSPFAGSILSQLNEQGNEAIANVPIQFAQQLLGQVPSAASGFTNASTGALSASIQGNNSQSNGNFGANPFGDLSTQFGGNLLRGLGKIF